MTTIFEESTFHGNVKTSNFIGSQGFGVSNYESQHRQQFSALTRLSRPTAISVAKTPYLFCDKANPLPSLEKMKQGKIEARKHRCASLEKLSPLIGSKETAVKTESDFTNPEDDPDMDETPQHQVTTVGEEEPLMPQEGMAY